MRTRIISAFPGTGKSFYHKNNPKTTLNSDSSFFSWITVGDKKERNSDFPTLTQELQHIIASEGGDK